MRDRAGGEVKPASVLARLPEPASREPSRKRAGQGPTPLRRWLCRTNHFGRSAGAVGVDEGQPCAGRVADRRQGGGKLIGDLPALLQFVDESVERGLRRFYSEFAFGPQLVVGASFDGCRQHGRGPFPSLGRSHDSHRHGLPPTAARCAPAVADDLSWVTGVEVSLAWNIPR